MIRRPPTAVFLGVFGIASLLITGFGIATAAGNLPVGPDQGWLDMFAANRHPVADAIAGFLNVAGGTVVMTIVTVVVVVALMVLRELQAALSVSLTVALASWLSTLIKVSLSRPRPADGLVDVASPSFPSGHTTTAAAITVAILIAFPRVWSWVLACTWIPLMALSRNYLLVHWLSDAVAGAVLGVSVALLVSGIVGVLLKARLPAPNPAPATISD
ncbi:MAG: phosphatase PAP2 family protein [Salinibacterium sp.]|nr:phosphatase PAP2 family protein [Salinibacterium sp.]